jgi:phospholipid/cholesterol/gamma-HCH transport system substrate-binding protein
VNTKPPSVRTLTALVIFLVSCVSLVIYLWIAFGGQLPFASQGYRMSVAFPYAPQLVDDADVRIAGVHVGKVVNVSLDARTHRTVAQLQIDPQFAPRPSDTRAILRQKTSLGEIYIELSGGSATAPKLPDGGTLPSGQVQPSVNFDDLLRTFNAPTRRALSGLLADQGAALQNGATPFSDFVYELDPFAINGADVVSALRSEEGAMRTLVRAGGEAIGALGASRAALQGLVTSGDRVFGATAQRNIALAAAVRALPPFLTSTRETVARITTSAQAATPLIVQLQPSAVQLAPTLVELSSVAPSLRQLFAGVGPLVRASKAGLPAFERALHDSEPLLARIKPYLGGVVPVVGYLALYKQEIAAFLGNLTAATQQSLPGNSNPNGPPLHVVRASLPINIESLAGFPGRIATDRANPYPSPRAATQLFDGLSTFGGYLCTTKPLPSLSTTIPSPLRQTIQQSYFTDTPSDPRPAAEIAPPCRSQGLLGPATGAGSGAFPQLTALP